MVKPDRRVQRTHKQLQQALIELIDKHDYDAITVQEIVDRADVGRTTFYEHYRSKDDLFMSCHEAVVSEFHHIHSHPESLLLPEAPPGIISAYRHLVEARTLLYPIFQSQDGQLILRRIRDGSARDIEAALHTIFGEADSAIPINILANYLAGAQVALVQWWLEKRQPYKPEDLAQTFHRLQRAAIRDAFGLRDAE
ncbi:MAG: TetR/AcrR family transcriptional regulator [Anaerolineae bacterium]|jgi:AcrR family transcriptional regulator|nr:TetR/AcrR family transcriptional regulator [Anaerolineae bacterium]